MAPNTPARLLGGVRCATANSEGAAPWGSQREAQVRAQSGKARRAAGSQLTAERSSLMQRSSGREHNRNKAGKRARRGGRAWCRSRWSTSSAVKPALVRAWPKMSGTCAAPRAQGRRTQGRAGRRTSARARALAGAAATGPQAEQRPRRGGGRRRRQPARAAELSPEKATNVRPSCPLHSRRSAAVGREPRCPQQERGCPERPPGKAGERDTRLNRAHAQSRPAQRAATQAQTFEQANLYTSLPFIAMWPYEPTETVPARRRRGVRGAAECQRSERAKEARRRKRGRGCGFGRGRGRGLGLGATAGRQRHAGRNVPGQNADARDLGVGELPPSALKLSHTEAQPH